MLRADWPKLMRNWRLMLLFAITGGGMFGTLQFVALHFTTALNMGVVGSVAPAFIVAASWLLFRDRLSPMQLTGVTISLSGVLVIVSQLDPARLASFSFNGGDLIIIANMMLWAVYSACLRLRPDIHPMTFMLAMAVIAGLGNLPFAALEYAFDYRLQPTWLTYVTVLYAAFVTTVLAYVAWNRGVDIVGAPRASAFLHTVPVFSVVLATTILGETVEVYHLLGFFLILAGVSLAARPSAQQRAAGKARSRGAEPAASGASSEPCRSGCRFAGTGCELGLQRLAVERLDHVVVGPGGHGAGDVGGVVLGRAVDDIGLFAAGKAAQRRQELHRAHAGHVEVQEDGVGHRLPALVERLLAALRLGDGKAHLLEDPPRHFANDVGIVNDKACLHAGPDGRWRVPLKQAGSLKRVKIALRCADARDRPTVAGLPHVRRRS